MHPASQEYRSSIPSSDLAPRLRPIGRSGEPLLVSYMQEDQWYAQEARPNDASYNVAYAIRLSGPLRFAALERAIDFLVDRHETLRTRFTAGREGVRQIIRSEEHTSELQSQSNLVCRLL